MGSEMQVSACIIFWRICCHRVFVAAESSMLGNATLLTASNLWTRQRLLFVGRLLLRSFARLPLILQNCLRRASFEAPLVVILAVSSLQSHRMTVSRKRRQRRACRRAA